MGDGNCPESFETIRIARDGRRLDLSVSISPVLDRRGRVTGASVIARDIGTRKQLEGELRSKNEQLQTQAEELAAQYEEMQLQNAELAEQDRQRNEFLAMLGHELRNPLAPISASVEILRSRGSDDPGTARQYAIIGRQARHLARIVDDLLDVSRITQGKVLLQKEPVDLSGIVEQAIQICGALIQERRHDFSTSYPPEPVMVESDPTRLVQVICNLLNNAAKYTEPGGRIRLSVERSGEWAILKVSDNGRGIAPGVLPHVFDLFVQGERTLARSEGGLGIGLTLVRRLVELHGGTVHAHSGGVDQGSEFTVRLPALAKPGPLLRRPGSHAGNGGLPAGQARVLLVDDNVDSNDALGALIREWGYPVWTAADAAAGLRLAAEHRPHAVLLDIGLPDLSGYEVVERLRARPETQHALIVAVSGYGHSTDRRRSLEAGFDQHFVKPVDPAVLHDLLEQAVARATDQ